jgi:hypothetical protein
LYFASCYKLRFASTDWHDIDSLGNSLTKVLEDISHQKRSEKKDMWMGICSSTFVEEVLMEKSYRAREIMEVVGNLTKERARQHEQYLNVFLIIMLNFAGEKLIWVDEKLRRLLKELRSRATQDNILLQVYSRRPMEIALRRRFTLPYLEWSLGF